MTMSSSGLREKGMAGKSRRYMASSGPFSCLKQSNKDTLSFEHAIPFPLTFSSSLESPSILLPSNPLSRISKCCSFFHPWSRILLADYFLQSCATYISQDHVRVLGTCWRYWFSPLVASSISSQRLPLTSYTAFD